MSIAYELAGRTHQKQRTRQALVAAAREMVAQGVTPTVEDAAAKASISRTTAYRYFPNQRALLLAAHPEMEAQSLLPEVAPEDAEVRLDMVIQTFLRIIVDTEPQQRTMLRLSLEPDPSLRGELPLRQGRAIGWIIEALAPLRARISEAKVRRLAIGIRSAAGIEPLVWLTDVAGLSRKEAVAVMRGSAKALLRSALADLDAGGHRPT
ncbi:MAG TPA: helix-turn-helix domain-containing protein [Candidatus Dormibacteraeota bacterium]|nr:helix-turn-helix domain-containing protein [Candidatus Dormibacteraeota bacterium]